MSNKEQVGKYVQLVDSMGDDLRVVNAARVSFNKESEWTRGTLDELLALPEGESPDKVLKQLKDGDKKLINYLAKHGHWTPFSQCMVTLRIKMPIFIARQWFKHQIGFTRNEVSRRYVDDKPEFWEVEEWRGKPIDNKKQGSFGKCEGAYLINNFTSPDREAKFLIEDATKCYNKLIEAGVAPEQARMVLPQSMMTEFYETASLAAYARLVKLRDEEHAQKEIQWYAQAVSEIMKDLFPVSWEALME